MGKTIEQVVAMTQRQVVEEFQKLARHLGAEPDITVDVTVRFDQLIYRVTINGIQLEYTGSIPDFLFRDDVYGDHDEYLQEFVRKLIVVPCYSGCCPRFVGPMQPPDIT